MNLLALLFVAQVTWTPIQDAECLTLDWFHAELLKRFPQSEVMYHTRHQAELNLLKEMASWQRADEVRFYRNGSSVGIVFLEAGCVVRDDGTLATEQAIMWIVIEENIARSLLERLKQASERSTI